MINDDDQKKLLLKKKARKATPNGLPKLFNIPRNWLHQAFLYMDTGEKITRLFLISLETIALWQIIILFFQSLNPFAAFAASFVLVHTWNWITNGLFWALMIFTFPSLRNPGAKTTVNYLNEMRERLSKTHCISGIAIYGSVTRGKWHNRSDIDIRFLRRSGFNALLCSSAITTIERFKAFINKQPMDLYLADDIDFLKKMRADEIPLILLDTDLRLSKMYPSRNVQNLSIDDLLNNGEE